MAALEERGQRENASASGGARRRSIPRAPGAPSPRCSTNINARPLAAEQNTGGGEMQIKRGVEEPSTRGIQPRHGRGRDAWPGPRSETLRTGIWLQCIQLVSHFVQNLSYDAFLPPIRRRNSSAQPNVFLLIVFNWLFF